MATKKKSKAKSNLVLIGSMVPHSTAAVLKLMAKSEERSVSKIIKKLIEQSTDFQEAQGRLEQDAA